MPAVFETPDSPRHPAGETRIRGFAGKGSMFEGTQGISIEEITDGTSNTVLIAVAAEPVPWTQPGELPFVEGEPLPALDASSPRGYALGMVDGSVHMLPRGEEKLLRLMITRNGGEVIVWPSIEGHGTTAGRRTPTAVTKAAPQYLPTRLQPTPTPAPMTGYVTVPGSTSPQAMEVRLQRVEEKLDRLLQKLDRLFPAADGNPSKP